MLRPIQDDDTPAAFRRCQPQKPGDIAHIVHPDLAAQPASFLIPGAFDRQHIGMRARRYPAEHGIGRIEGKAHGPAASQQPPGKPERERRLANAFRPGQQPRMMHAAA